ncbi:dicarboxylate/amino acid:cation symporter [Sinorhizobium sp. BG8]|uniref:dicarboxylate/amino acid:cation symporter n=1 Tax=Sinorhizobium sp. BG8 TaxID=2613773 RepID=UPI00193E01E8|nr:dicarboxylate/amino acid:cation symporter [Sinorhizobium sp. BG8]QRM55922.1 dicarboxylate/amino acid:cation symporter [Sinorhizobium sp. BG8]
MTEAIRKTISGILLHPVGILLGMGLGGLYGWIDKGGTPAIELLGDIFLRLLQMCVIPLLFTAVVTSLAKLFSDGAARRYVTRLVLFIGLGLTVAGGLGMFMGEIGRPGSELQHQAKQIIGEVIFRAEAAAPDALANQTAGIADIALGIVPSNIFVALSSGNMLAILFFAVLFGVALGSIDKRRSAQAITLFESLYETFIKIIGWLMYVLPFGLFCLAYTQVSSVGMDVLMAMTRLVLLIYLGCGLLIAFYSIITWVKAGGGYWRSVAALKESMFIAFGTSSSFAAVPAAMRGLKDGLGLDRNSVDMVMPLGITLNPPGSVFHFALATMFLANLYGVDLDLGWTAFVIVASMLAGVAAAGAPGIAGLSMISLILVPLGLPVEVAIILLAAIDPIVDPILTVVNLQANSATTALIGGKEENAFIADEVAA